MVQILRPALRRQLSNYSHLSSIPLRSTLSPFRILRYANNYYGPPHKEYFQRPGQAPLPDSTPYDPREPIQTVPVDSRPSRLFSAARGIFWAGIFLALGGMTGCAFLTWEYLQPPFEPGSEEEQGMQQEIADLLDTHTLVQDFREKGWKEEDMTVRSLPADRSKGQHLVHDKLRGSSQTLTMKAFTNEAHEFTFVVFFCGFGLDGFPDVMHGGVTATMILEAINKHISSYSSFSRFDTKLETPAVRIDYRKPVRPGDIYTVMVAPTSETEPNPDDLSKENLHFAVLLLRLDSMPDMSTSFDAVSGSITHSIAVQSDSGDSPVMATADITVPVTRKPRAKPPVLQPITFQKKATQDSPESQP